MRALAVLLLPALFGCATTSAQVVEAGPRCDGFAAYDARVTEQLERLLAEAPGDTLVRETSRLNAARRACAKHVLQGLLAVREERGVEAVQQELDALTAVYAQPTLEALLTETLGPEQAPLVPLLEEARQRVARQQRAAPLARRDETEREKLKVEAPASLGPEPEVPATLCDAPTPCAQLRCVLEHPEASSTRAARACLDEAAAWAPWKRAARAAEVLSLVPQLLEARTQLDTLRLQLWPEVEAAKEPGRAAQLASVFGALPAVQQQVTALRDAGREHHLARARASSAIPEAAWLHGVLAQRLGGPEVAPLENTGVWEPLRWRCKASAIDLPPLPAGVRGTLSVRCLAADAGSRKKEDAMRTFELESDLRSERVDGSLTVVCAEKRSVSELRVVEPGLEGFPEEALRQELARKLAGALSECTRLHGFAATRDCAELRRLPEGELLTRFVTHARFTGRWEPCFEEWLQATYGAVPPPPTPARDAQ